MLFCNKTSSTSRLSLQTQGPRDRAAPRLRVPATLDSIPEHGPMQHGSIETHSHAATGVIDLKHSKTAVQEQETVMQTTWHARPWNPPRTREA